MRPRRVGVEYELDCIIYASGFEVGTEFSAKLTILFKISRIAAKILVFAKLHWIYENADNHLVVLGRS